jgi:hypothetical protein
LKNSLFVDSFSGVRYAKYLPESDHSLKIQGYKGDDRKEVWLDQAGDEVQQLEKPA